MASILVVDDEPDVAEAIRAVLENAGLSAIRRHLPN
jgi:CheY-like chemotaxis protein